MNRRGKIYKQHYACFQCRKAFKKNNIQEIPKDQLLFDEKGRIVHCPQCGERMPDVGYDFEAPKQNDIAGWKAAEARLETSLSYKIRNSQKLTKKVQKKFRDSIDSNRHMINRSNKISKRKDTNK